MKKRIIGILLYPLFPIILALSYESEYSFKTNVRDVHVAWLESFWHQAAPVEPENGANHLGLWDKLRLFYYKKRLKYHWESYLNTNLNYSCGLMLSEHISGGRAGKQLTKAKYFHGKIKELDPSIPNLPERAL